MAGTLITNSIAPDVGTNLYLNATQGAANVVIGNTTTALATFTNTGTLIVSNVVGNLVGNVVGGIANTQITGNIISSQITSVANTQITGTITNNVNSTLVTANTLTISTLSDGTNSTSTTNCIQGSAKAWVTFQGSTGTRYASYNVSSVTRTTTGTYTITFTNAFSDIYYSWTGMALNAAGGGSIPYNLPSIGQRTYAPTTTTLQVATAYQQSTSATDFDYVYVQVFR